MLVAGLGKRLLVSDLQPADFASLKSKMARKKDPPQMSAIVQVMLCAFERA
jgi:hypothetical protein